MIDSTLFVNINRSWLYFLSQAFAAAGIDFIYQTNQLRTNDAGQVELASDLVIASPANQWRISVDTPDTIEMNFRIGVLTKQDPGEVLVAHYRNQEIQAVIQQALFAPERSLDGYSIGGSRTYAVPLRQFNSSGDPSSMLDEFGIRYDGGNIWNDQTPDGSDPQLWVLEIPITVSQ
jgi:hypothetical protein